MISDLLDRDRLVESAMASTGLDDFGEPTWLEGLDRLLDDLVEEARLHDLGTHIVAGEIGGHLITRLGLVDWRKSHPEVAAAPITRPIVILGQPRTGTTILYDLLARDPRLRAPLSWEVDRPCPPPETATYDSDPRIAEVQAKIDMAETLIPGFTAFHPLGARLAQECVRMTVSAFRSMSFTVQYRVPRYRRWMTQGADPAVAYRWHRCFLQHLQSAHPAPRWLLKSPAHLWHVKALLAEYPDAMLIQTHRDPLRVLASMSALTGHFRRLASDEISLAEIAGEYAAGFPVALRQSISQREDGTIPAGQIIDIRYTDFVADPFAVIRQVYDRLGTDLPAETEARMRRFLAAYPSDGGGGATRYSFADTGLDAGELRERFTLYQERFGVESEPIR